MSKNIIFVLLDGARYDRLNQSSDFMELSNHGTLLNNVTTAIPYTFGSLNVILTGKYGKENGVDGYYKMFQLKNEIPFLPEILQKNGYFTARGLISDKILSKRGFDIRRDFDEYTENLNLRHPELIKEVYKKSNDKPFFILLQFTRIHTVTVTEVLKKFEWNDERYYNSKISNLKKYDDTFKEAGIYAANIKKTVDELGLSENTIIIFFSDHGTGIGERFGERNYGSFTFEETIRTFYLFLGNKILKNQSSDSLLSTIDIFPTLLDICNIRDISDFEGKSFSDYLFGNVSSPISSKYAFSETGALHGPFVSPEKSNVFCIKNNDFKLIYLKDPNEWELYNLLDDPLETKNLIGTGLDIENKLKIMLEKWINR
tara:strand:- start:3521 stop:4636 length:1116 start_codon:yes stop_codon:yes gene_type:complete